MKLNELIASCQNQWMKGFEYNPLFTIRLLFEDKSEYLNESNYILKGNYINDNNYLIKYREREVKYWYIEGKNDITIEIEGHY